MNNPLDRMAMILERLAELFPNTPYQKKLDALEFSRKNSEFEAEGIIQ